MAVQFEAVSKTVKLFEALKLDRCDILSYDNFVVNNGKKKLTLKQVAKIMSANIWEHLKTLSPRERQKRLDKGLKTLRRIRLAKASASKASKPGQSSQAASIRLVARSR